ncbi:hypothetical protein [Anaerosolibacter sp.]|uniref:hypothetical protein n=1 Tax=Anaerosolibacter sp. TaxID=1872527 RepID=UPI0039EFD7ED
MAIMSSKLLRHTFCMEELRKIGAQVINVQGIKFYVKYTINNLNIEYLYHVNPDDTYLLERIKPYLLIVGEYPTEEDIVEAIKVDIDQFKNAMKSKNFNDFVAIDRDLTDIVRYFEDLYLYYNIDREDLSLMKEEINHVVDLILQIKNRSQRVYHKKDPDNLKDK